MEPQPADHPGSGLRATNGMETTLTAPETSSGRPRIGNRGGNRHRGDYTATHRLRARGQPRAERESPDCGNTALQELRNNRSELIISSLRLRYRFRPGWAGESNTSPGATEVILRWILGTAPFGLRITQLGGRLFSFRFS